MHEAWFINKMADLHLFELSALRIVGFCLILKIDLFSDWLGDRSGVAWKGLGPKKDKQHAYDKIK